MSQLSYQDLKFIIESLKYTKYNFENYDKYPSYEYKQKRIKEANDVLSKVEALLKKKGVVLPLAQFFFVLMLTKQSYKSTNDDKTMLNSSTNTGYKNIIKTYIKK